ncbi:FAD-binding oxidoreductase [Calditrichota bacterium]
MNTLRGRLKDILGIDRWVDAAYPAVAVESTEEVVKLMSGFPGQVMIVGQGTNFAHEFTPTSDCVVLFTQSLDKLLEFSVSDQTVAVSSGVPVSAVNETLAEQDYNVPALWQLDKGSVGGRLATIGSRQSEANETGWTQSLLGVTIINSAGDVIKLGGKCIKDVAGYNLMHMYTGSRGSYGVIVEAIFRCRPGVPERMEDVAKIVATNLHDRKWKRVFDPAGRMLPGA